MLNYHCCDAPDVVICHNQNCIFCLKIESKVPTTTTTTTTNLKL